MIKKVIPGLTLCLVLLLAVSTAFAVEGTKSGSKLDKSLIERSTKYIDVNQIRSSVMNNGTYTRHPISGNSDMEWPKGSGKYICYAAGIWIAGKVNDKIRTACSDYYIEYQPGLVLPDGKADDPALEKYRVYKVHKDYPNGETVLEIDPWSVWPADQGAPVNADGSIKWTGDEMLYAVMNDLDQNKHNNNFNTLPIGIELHLLVFAFDRAGALGNSIFAKYTIINKGKDDLLSAYVGAWSDVDNGDANDDLLGFDLPTGMSYCFGGGPIDVTYGSRPPALGWDFFQGPIVDSPGDTVRLPNGRMYPNKKILFATSFNKYYNSHAIYRDPPQSAIGSEWCYNYLAGLQKDGQPWIDPYTGLPSTFLNTGDPVTGTGWLSTEESPPADVRMLTGSGPFTLAVGDTQEIVLGCVIAQGKDRLSSVSLLRLYDKQLQQAYDLGFQVPNSPLSPPVVVSELDGEILLTWSKQSENYVQAGYQFEGYNIYIGGSPAGPWKLLKTYDVSNSVLSVLDEGYDENTGLVLQLPSAFGSDTGLKYQYSITKDYTGFNLANGRTYYIVTTSYSYGATATPRILESSKNVIYAVPHQPRPGSLVTHEAFETIKIDHVGTASKEKFDFWVQLMDPLHVQTADYEVVINPDNSWTLWRNGQAVPGFTNRTDYGFTRDAEFNTAYQNGIDFFLGVDANFVLDPITTFKADLVTKTSDPSVLTELYGPSVLAGGQYKTNLAKDGVFKKGTKSPNFIFNPLQIRFTGTYDTTSREVVSGGSLATLLYSWGDLSNFLPKHPKNPVPNSRNPFLVRIPFEIWDTARNIQLNVGFTDRLQKLSDSQFVPTWHPRGECIVYAFASQYDEQIHNCTYTGTDTMATWSFIFGPNAKWKTGDIVEFSYPQPLPVTGKEITLIDAKGQPVTLQPDKFKFTIKGQQDGVVDDAKKRLDLINVYPNPYFAYNLNETRLFQENVMFINLPEKCTIRIFTIAGQLVRTIEHVSPITVNNLSPFDSRDAVSERWDLRNETNLPVASGFYIAHIDVPNVGQKILKLAIVFRQQRLKNL